MEREARAKRAGGTCRFLKLSWLRNKSACAAHHYIHTYFLLLIFCCFQDLLQSPKTSGHSKQTKTTTHQYNNTYTYSMYIIHIVCTYIYHIYIYVCICFCIFCLSFALYPSLNLPKVGMISRGVLGHDAPIYPCCLVFYLIHLI